MSALVPYNRNGFSQIHFESHKQKKNRHYDRRFIGPQPFTPPLYPILPNYQPFFYPIGGYPGTGYNQFGRSSMSTDLISLNQANKHYQYAQYMRHMNEIQRHWKQRANTMPLPRRADAFPPYYRSDKEYLYEKETRFLPYPVYIGQGGLGFGPSQTLGYGDPSNLGYNVGFTPALANIRGVRNLPPKIRVIFIPTGFPSSQQSYANALAMPPFTYNRMSQPLCSLPLPPPLLPQIGSLSLTPIVQQMVIQQYANPIAVLPFTPNFQMSQPMISGYPQIPQQQLMVPPLTLPSPQSIPQPYGPAPLIPANMPVYSPNAPLFPFSCDTTSAGLQYPNSGYPSTCRACVPPPPPLNIPVADHRWTQHCSACYHVPADASSPNIRPTNGRSTPLLRHPIVLQNSYNPPMQQPQYPHVNPSIAMRPWLHSIPPLPQGAVIISDEYISRENLGTTYNFSKKYAVQHPHVYTFTSRSKSLSTDTTNQIKPETKSQRKYEDDKSQSRNKSTSLTQLSHSHVSHVSNVSNIHRSTIHSSSSSSSCSSCDALPSKEKQKSDRSSNSTKNNLARKQLSVAARNINLRYNYQIPDLPSVYHNNRYLKSSDTEESTFSNSSSSSSPFINKELKNGRPPSPVYLHVIREEEEDQKSIRTLLSTTSFQSSQKPVTKTIIIRTFTRGSPSTVSTISFNPSLNTLDDDFDSISMTNTIKTNRTDEQSTETSETS